MNLKTKNNENQWNKKNWFFEIINKIEKPLATQRERKQINIRNERENVIADLKDIKRIIEY